MKAFILCVGSLDRWKPSILTSDGQGNKVLVFASSPSVFAVFFLVSSPFLPSPSPSFHRLVAVFACAIASSLSLPAPSPRRCLCLRHRLVAVFACAIASSLSLPAPSPRHCLCLRHRLVAVFACLVVVFAFIFAFISSPPSPYRRRLIAGFALTFASVGVVVLLPSFSPSSHRCLQLRHRLISVFVAAYIFVCGLQRWNNRIEEKTPERCLTGIVLYCIFVCCVV
ncbi:uncharacterized protein LOC116936496 [Daphnia magna]|uniref:uncharacterized protein LOC116936496 n=1 Tax=Daphnia magna TaxID=35525 RepID=UPI001E1BB63B|nr:uncharacterized protein LOC116936496 [Daphnia magna]